jgi:SET domain-containing protein
MSDSDEEEESVGENMEECNGDNSCDHDHSHEAMDEQELLDADTGDLSLNKLNTILQEYGVDNLFTPLDGTALFSTLCKINHSCDPNVKVKYAFTREYGLVATLTALKDIITGAELLQSYIDQTMGKKCTLLTHILNL